MRANMIRSTAAALALLTLPGIGAEKVRNLSLPAAGIGKLVIQAGEGALRVTGREGLDEIVVLAEIVVDDPAVKDLDAVIRDHFELDLRRSGATALLVGRGRESGSAFYAKAGRIDLTIVVPKRMALDIQDGPGKLNVQDIAADVHVTDGTGSLKLSRITGNVSIDDEGGAIVVDRITGGVDIVDNTGDIEVRDTAGDVVIVDGPDAVTVVKAGGSVRIDDSTGSVLITDVAGDARLDKKGKGDVEIARVRGKVVRSGPF